MEVAMKIKSGGGLTSNKLVQSKGWKEEPKPHAVSPAAVNQMGVSTQFKKEPLVSGPGYKTGPMADTGIAGASRGPAGAGPGGMGRTIYASGSQSKTPAAQAPGKGRDILSAFGPEATGKR